MPPIAESMVCATDIATAWRETVRMVESTPEGKMFHTVTRISDPTAENGDLRRAANQLLQDVKLPGIETVSNTIFPEKLSAKTTDLENLSSRYLSMYPSIKKFPGNSHGTYFGRMVSYDTKRQVNQLLSIKDRIVNQLEKPGTMSSSYEMTIPDDQDDHEYTVRIQTPGTDVSLRGFPCLSSLGFQIGDGHLHLLAHYRYEYLISKGYGNYLGLARLQRYIADQTGLKPGVLTVTAGRAYVDVSRQRVRRYLEGLPLD
ncbi:MULTISPECIES: hypothetical protein [unclassified Rhodococcus (in: high G+C Gram-positive bacteria)]|uniref:hypothetical protein n=1 Tax=unclassified Rhodococcus (in: high G+C Gram-positive bacteria) TaxID=192944 RepID=UPI00113FCE0E|nr:MULTISPECIES: hypothetical protein [unclassified Rhodococcus (in: high G+C Gram-positive bacteria)]